MTSESPPPDDLSARGSRDGGTALERELERTRKQLQATIAELESSNEQLHATNDRLRSTIDELAEHRSLLQLIIDRVPALISYVDANLCYRLVNRAYGEWFGVPLGDIEGRSVEALVGETAWPTVGPFVHGALAGQAASYEAEVPYRSGGTRYIRAEYTPDVAPDGTVRGMIALVHDITRRRAQERALEDASARKDEFLAMLAHELRNPMSPILHGIELLKREHEDPATQAAVLERLERQTHHLKRLVDDLLDASRVSRGMVSLEVEPLDLREVLGDLAVDYRRRAEEEHKRLELDLPELPLVVEGDAVRLGQIIENLLTNAMKFTSHGDTVWLSASQDEAMIEVVVRDDGLGIDPDVLPVIFELFHQGRVSLARERGGLGIGLTTARKLVRLHDGDITAQSAGSGEGATFRVRLPRSHAVLPERVSQVPGPVERPSRRVLVVEDDADAAETLALLLSRWGHDVRTAFDGERGLELAAAVPPEIVLLDLGLPRMDGFEVIRRLRALPDGEAISIVVLSGYGQARDRTRAREVGADQHLTKPASAQDLREVLRVLPRRRTDA